MSTEPEDRGEVDVEEAKAEVEVSPFAPSAISGEETDPRAGGVTDGDEQDENPDAKPVEEVTGAGEAEPGEQPPEATGERDWFILKVQSNRENSIADGLLRRVKMAGLEAFFGDIIVPTEKVTEFKAGKKRVTKRKLYPGYIVVNMEINEESWFLVRETPGIGDFTGAAGKPTPMLAHEVEKIVATAKPDEPGDTPKLRISFNVGDRVKINDGNFESFEGDVDNIDETNGRVTVMINIFGRSTPVELEYWQIEAV